MRHHRALLLLVLLLGLTAGGLVASSAGAGGPVRLDAHERNLIRAATKQYRDVEAAIADGYVPTDHCVDQPGSGMGYHYVHPELIGDQLIDPEQPDILVYHDGPNGKLRLGAVEYLIFDDDGSLETDDDLPFLFGKHRFDGPMPGHEPGMPVHYDLHVWLYEHNPDGELTAWNPRVSC